jgi:Tfp pilus assembly protein FimT
LLIVISLLALLASFSVPTLSRFAAGFSLSASARALASAARAVQSQARLQHRTLSLDLGKINLPARVRIKKSSEIRFSSSGFPPPGGSGTIVLENQFKKTKKIIVSSAGRVRIE